MLETKKAVALIGSPNSGKTTLLNDLTHSHFKVVNYPGSTVEIAKATLSPKYGETFEILDTPGVYSLTARSDDERVTVEILENPNSQVGQVVVVVDATQLSRALLLVHQVAQRGHPTIIALTMMDLIEKSGTQVDLKLLSESLGLPIVPINSKKLNGLQELANKIREGNSRYSYLTPHLSKAENDPGFQDELFQYFQRLTKKVIRINHPLDAQLASEKIDRLLLHPFFGYLAFAGIMTSIFTLVFWVAAPFMDTIDLAFSSLIDFVQSEITNPAWSSFLANGIIGGIGSVLVFVPQIFFLFLAIHLLESSGYLARAATLIDRPFSAIGLNGRSFVPLLSGFACAIPALMAARSIPSKRDRWITLFIIPLMTCSARLPVYGLLLSFLFRDAQPWKAGLSLTLLYGGAMIVGIFAAKLLDLMLKREGPSSFLMELPLYRKPHLNVVFYLTLKRVWVFVKRAGPVIFAFTLLIWIGTSFPRSASQESPPLSQSYLGRAGKLIEPVMEPLGGDWRVGVSLLSAFAAREVFVSSLATLFNMTDLEDEGMKQGFLENMATATKPSGEALFTPASVIALLVFVMIALQCTATTAVYQRETGSWKWALLQVGTLNLFAYTSAVLIYQVLFQFFS